MLTVSSRFSRVARRGERGVWPGGGIFRWGVDSLGWTSKTREHKDLDLIVRDAP